MSSETRVAVVLPLEHARLLKKITSTAMDASLNALEAVPSVEVKTMIVAQRALLYEIQDALELALLPHETETEG